MTMLFAAHKVITKERIKKKMLAFKRRAMNKIKQQKERQKSKEKVGEKATGNSNGVQV
jgi:hypothetical protein